MIIYQRCPIAFKTPFWYSKRYNGKFNEWKLQLYIKVKENKYDLALIIETKSSCKLWFKRIRLKSKRKQKWKSKKVMGVVFVVVLLLLVLCQFLAETLQSYPTTSYKAHNHILQEPCFSKLWFLSKLPPTKSPEKWYFFFLHKITLLL